MQAWLSKEAEVVTRMSQNRGLTLPILLIASLLAIGLLVLLEARKADGAVPAPTAPEPAANPAVAATPVPARSVAVAASGAVTRQGTWAYAAESYGPDYLAIPEGPGFDVRVCGPLGCLERVSTDAGPVLALQKAGRIGDLSAVMFRAICGPLGPGLCPGGSYTILGVADQSGEDPPENEADASMRIEDGGPGPTLPATSTADAVQ